MGPVACKLLITDLQDTNSSERYTRPCKSSAHLFGVISRHKPFYTSPSSNSAHSHFLEHTVLFMPQCLSSCSAPIWSTLLPPFSAQKKCIHPSRFSAATIISVNSFLTSSRKKINCCLLIVLCSSCNYHATLNHCMSVCFTWLWNSEDRTWLYFISCWPSTWHLVVLDKCSMNEWLYKWGEKKGFQCVKKYSKPCWSWNGCRLGSSYLKKWFYYIIFWISGNHCSKEMGEIALEVNIFWGIHKEDFMF